MNRKYFAVASLVLGILALVDRFVAISPLEYWFGLAGIICGLLGIKSEKKNLAIAGLVLSILLFVLSVIMIMILTIMSH